jgi:alkaline phosphatase D
MNMPRFIMPVLLVLLAWPAPAQPATKRNTEKAATGADKPKQINRGDLVGNMQLLNLWGDQPEAAQRLYEAAYKILAARPDASFADLASDAVVQRLCVEAGVTHFGGPMLGAVRSDGAAVWLRTLRPAKVEVRMTVDGHEKAFGPVASTEQSDLTAVVEISGLKPDTRYPYRVLTDGKPISTATTGTLVTSPAAGPAKARIAFGSCFHRWGLGNPRQAEALCQREPTALLVYGDIAVQDRDNHLGLHRADYLLRDFHPAWQRIAASFAVYATWDDHDHFNNDKWGLPNGYTEKDRQGVWEVFRHAWNNPSYGFNDERRGVFLHTRVGPCDVILVDHRYFRTARTNASDPSGNFLGSQQMQWLEKQLLDCKGPFIILSCGTMWSDYVSNGKDSWGKYDPQGREAIFNLVEKHRIPGVLLTSGDRHGARVFRIPRPSGYNFYEFEPASLGGRGDGPPAVIRNCDAQLFGVAGKYAFGEFSFDATLADPQVVFRLIEDSGQTLYELKLTRQQLTPP